MSAYQHSPVRPPALSRPPSSKTGLPLTGGRVKALERERRWLPKLARTLPITIPTVVGTGEPAEGYPWAWSVHYWIEGENPVEGHLAKPGLLARDLAEFVKAIRRADVDGGPSAYRGRAATRTSPCGRGDGGSGGGGPQVEQRFLDVYDALTGADSGGEVA